ncbi:MAG: 4-hydroxythreonine-4-phosphate dehydrogenase PdxA [Alphaproteobacteria bacterium]|nr:4-hydroxythreonine-4-phosphate dehydrogenase PdxA [Alphaproteobacteria bacterium]
MADRPRLRPLALTMGEPAGIAGEIVVKVWHAPDGRPIPRFAVIGDPDWLRAEAHRIKSHSHVVEVSSLDEAAARFHEGVPVLPLRLATRAAPGKPDGRNAQAVIGAIEMAVSLARRGEASGVVTNPIHKATLYDAGFTFPGHTEYLASLCGGATPVMMLAIEGLRVVPVTVHLSLAQAVRALSSEAIVAAAAITHQALIKDFGIASPRLAVAALNPHAGENGAMGDEEKTVIGPALAQLRARGIDAVGPLPADTLFHAGARKRFDAAICMYHDQALIPLKTLDFAGGVNVTLGLPIVRTSPDHGTAFDIAGQDRADPTSLLAALRMAERIAMQRATTA